LLTRVSSFAQGGLERQPRTATFLVSARENGSHFGQENFLTRVNGDPDGHLSGRKAVMSRALLALALGFALGGGPPLQWAYSLAGVLQSATSDYGSIWDPNGSPSNPDYGGSFDPDGSQSDSDYGGSFDPNG
jgi:hypothetical protein